MHAMPARRPGLSSDAWPVLSRIYDVGSLRQTMSGLRLAVAVSLMVHLAVLAWPMLERTKAVAPTRLQARLMPARLEMPVPTPTPTSTPVPVPMPASRSAAAPKTDRLARHAPGTAASAPMSGQPARESAAAPVVPAVTESTPAAGARVEEAPPRFDAEYLANAAPEYPRFARQRGIEGRVLLRVLVSADGTAGRVELARSSGNELLDQSALRTVGQWRFVPARRGQTAVEAWVEVPVAFRLNHG